ncbi:hypothetical protein D3C79_1029500 [compost metagenome]
MHRIQPVTRSVEGQERRIDQIANYLDKLQAANLLVDAIDRDAITPGVALSRRTRSDIGIHRNILQ